MQIIIIAISSLPDEITHPLDYDDLFPGECAASPNNSLMGERRNGIETGKMILMRIKTYISCY